MGRWGSRTAAAVFAALGLFWMAPGVGADESSDALMKQIDALHWQKGPTDVAALKNAKLQLPHRYIFLDSDEADDFLRLTQNIPGDIPEQILAPYDFHWWASVDFSEDGYVKDEEKLDNNAILTTMRDATEQSNDERRRNGWGELHVVGWRHPPHYDTTTKRLEWSLDLKDETGHVSTNFQTRVLGRRGVTNFTLVTGPETLDADVAEFKSVLAGYQFNAGDSYAEYKEGDKVAEYGLAALIVGGGAAVAAKSGLLKFLGKFIWIGLAAVGAVVMKLFRRKA
ncbi:DUF2167 domain-containing protein [Dongia sp.]|uniref:DUF2167 domain-containing protein n=1 Tax=Dongia sp. TaxID=1977262 RepID=UPI00375287BB